MIMSSNITRWDISRAGIIFLQDLQMQALLECGFYSREDDLSRKRPQWKKTAVEKVYGDKDYSI